MPAVEKTILPFINRSESTVIYSESMRTMYGKVPKLEVFYWDGDKYNVAGIFTNIRFEVSSTGYEEAEGPTHPGAPPPPPPTVSRILIDHGGVSTGIIKIG